MTTQTQIRRGTASACDAITPAEGEMLYDMTNDRMRIGDGLRQGGWVLASAADIQNGAFISGTTTASGNDLTVAIDPAPAAYAAKMTYVIQPPANTTGGSAIRVRVNALSYVDVYKISGGAVVITTGGEMVGGGFYTIRHDGTHWVLESSGGDVASVSALDTSLVITPTTGAVTARINTNNSLGVGSLHLMSNALGANIANGGTTTGANLRKVNLQAKGSTTDMAFTLGAAPAGTWRNVSGDIVSGGSGGGQNIGIGIFQRTA